MRYFRVALLQLALKDRVFLLDTLALDRQARHAQRNIWLEFTHAFLGSDQVLKLGNARSCMIRF